MHRCDALVNLFSTAQPRNAITIISSCASPGSARFRPSRTGIAGGSAELVAALRGAARHRRFVDHVVCAGGRRRPRLRLAPARGTRTIWWSTSSAIRRITITMWPYALRYPGLVVLHDTRLHHARAAAAPPREAARADYRAEFALEPSGREPGCRRAGGRRLRQRSYYDWPMVRPLVETSRLVAVHGDGAARPIADARCARARACDRYVSGEGEPCRRSSRKRSRSRRDPRSATGSRTTRCCSACFGGLTPEKRLPQILDALVRDRALRARAQLLLGGRARRTISTCIADVAAPASRRSRHRHRLSASDAELTDHLAACDVSLNLRWPTARETPAPGCARSPPDGRRSSSISSTWRCPVAGSEDVEGKPWRIEDRWLEDRTRRGSHPDQCGRRLGASTRSASPSTSSTRTTRCGSRCGGSRDDAGAARAARPGGASLVAARAFGRGMVDDYERVIAEAAAAPAPAVELPAHLRADGTADAALARAPHWASSDALSQDGLLE